jgi:hypothetical protein
VGQPTSGSPRRLSTAPGRPLPQTPGGRLLCGVTMTPPRLKPSSASRLERLVKRAMTFAVSEYHDDTAVARLAWLAQGDDDALDQACDVCLSYLDVDLAVRGRAIGLLARVRYGDLPS